MNRVQVSIRAFFVSSDLEYRSYDLRSDVSIEDAERLLARNGASLAKRSYAVSKALAERIEGLVQGGIQWNFDEYYYQIGAFLDSSVFPEGFLLQQRSIVDGSFVELFAPREPYDLTVFRSYIDLEKLSRYEVIFLGGDLKDGFSRCFLGADSASEGDCFFELTPILRTHADYYLERYGFDLRTSGNKGARER